MTIPLEDLNRTATHQRKTLAADGQGGFTPTWTTQTPATFPCRLWPASGTERELAARSEDVVTHALVCLPTVDLQRGDLLTIDSESYDVRTLLPPSEPDHHTKVLVEEIQLGR